MVERIQAEMATSIALDTLKATNSLRGLNDAVTSVKNAWKAQEAAAKSSGDYLKASQERYNGLSREMEAQKNKITELQQRQKGLDTSTKEGAESFLKYERNIQQANQKLASLESQQQRAKSSMEYQTSGLAKLQQEYKQMNQVSDSYVNRLKAEHNTRAANITSANSMKASLSNLSQQYVKQSEELKRIEQASGSASDAYKRQAVRVNETATNVANMKNELKLTQAEVNRANPYGLSKYASGANGAYRAAEKMGNGFHAAGQKIKDMAYSSSIAIVGIGAVSIKGAQAATNLQESYVKTLNLATTGGEKAAEAQKNVNQMQKDGAKYSVQYGKSQQAIAEGYQELIKRGYTSAEALGAMKSELQASVASGDDFNDVLSVTSQVVDAYGMRTDNAAKMTKNTKEVVNQLAYAADMTATDFQSLGKGMEYVGDSAHSAGFKLSETSAAMGILSNHGLEADKAGTGLRKVINSITGALSDQEAAQKGSAASIDSLNEKIADHQKKIADYQAAEKAGTKSSKSAASAIKTQQEAIEKLNGKVQAIKSGGTSDMLSKLGISRSQLVDSNGNLRDMTTIMEVINEKTKNMGTAQKNSVFNSLFGTTGQQAGIILAQNNQELDELNKKVEKSADGQGYVANLAKKNMTTVKAELQQFSQAGQAVMIMIGKQMLPVISEAAVKMAKAFNSKEGQDGLKKIADGVAWVGDKLVGLVEYIGTHTGQIKAFAEVFAGIWAFKKISDTIGWIKTAIGTYKELNGVLKTTAALTTAANVTGSVSGIGKVGTVTKTTGAIATNGAMTTGVSTLASSLSKALPYVGVLAGLAQAGTSLYAGTQTKDQTKQRADYTGAGVSVGGAALGAAIGSTVAPGIGTAIGAALGGTFGLKLGKKLGADLQNGFKESHPKSLAAWIGEDWDEKYKSQSSATMKKFSSDYNSQIGKLNSNLSLKLSVDTKDNDKNKQKIEGIYKDLQKVIDDFYKKQNGSTKKNLDTLVKNGAITKKQEDDILKNSQDNNKKKADSQKKLVDDMKKSTSNYYDNAAKINSGGTKTLEGIAKKYGTNSKKYKKEQQKELESLQSKHSKVMADYEVKLDDKVSKASQVAATKQEDILSSLNNSKKKLNLKDILETERTAKNNHDVIVKNAQKTRDDAVKAANVKYKKTVGAAEQEYYQNHSISKKQYNAIVKKAQDTRDDTIDAAEKQKKGKVKHADEEYGKIVGKAEQQRKDVTSKSALQKDKSIEHAQKQKDGTTKLGTDQKNALQQAASDQAHGVLSKSASQANGSMEAASKQGSGLQKIWNNITDFFNGLVKAFGIKPTPKSAADYSYKPISVPGFARGTNGAPGGHALVGEEGIEALYSPKSGKMELLGTKGAQIVNLNPGDQILNAKDTAKLFQGGIGKTLPGFAKGTSDLGSFLNSIAKGASDIWDDVSDAASDALSKLTDPVKSLTEIASKAFNVNSISEVGDIGHETSKSMIDKGINDGFAKIIKKIKTSFVSSNSSSGDGGGGKGAPSGAGVSRWRSQVVDALKANGLSTSESMVNKVLRQIQTESGGNEKAVQGNIGDVNNASGDLAKGLMQVISATFNAYKFPGHNNPFNGYDSLLAGLAYAKNRYGSNLSFLGQGHGYANGTITNTPHLANIAEGGMTEAVIPWDLSKKSRAMELLGETVTHFAKNTSSNTTISESSVRSDNSDVINQLKQAVELLTQLVQGQGNPVPVNVAIDKNELYRKQSQDGNMRGYQSLA